MFQALGRFLIRLGRRLAPDATYEGHTVLQEIGAIHVSSGIDDMDVLLDLHRREEAMRAAGAHSQVTDATPAVIGAETDADGRERLVVRGRAGVLEFGSARSIGPTPASTRPSVVELNRDVLPVEALDDMVRFARTRTTAGRGFVADTEDEGT